MTCLRATLSIVAPKLCSTPTPLNDSAFIPLTPLT